MTRRILMTAFHFPPVRVSSGIQRTLRFATYLGEHRWQPVVLTVHPRAYQLVSDDQLGDIPDTVPVIRAQGWDTTRHFAIRGRYWSWMAQPDGWVSWVPFGILKGLAAIRRHRPDVLFSTSPIVSAHLIGMALARLSGLPWVADLRDAITEPNYPRDPTKFRIHRGIEAALVRRAARVIFTTEGTREVYAQRYPQVPASRWAVIENGFDEGNFQSAQATMTGRDTAPGRRLTLLHAGVLYPEERDPRPFFEALGRLKASGGIDASRLRVVLRATAHDHLYRPLLAHAGIEDIVELAPTIGYEAALSEMMRADGLLIFQGSICNQQVPAKLYEYYRSGRPILALADPIGDTATAMRAAGATDIIPMDDAQAIVQGLPAFLDRIRSGIGGVPRAIADRHSRRARTGELARLLDALV